MKLVNAGWPARAVAEGRGTPPTVPRCGPRRAEGASRRAVRLARIGAGGAGAPPRVAAPPPRTTRGGAQWCPSAFLHVRGEGAQAGAESRTARTTMVDDLFARRGRAAAGRSVSAV